MILMRTWIPHLLFPVVPLALRIDSSCAPQSVVRDAAHYELLQDFLRSTAVH